MKLCLIYVRYICRNGLVRSHRSLYIFSQMQKASPILHGGRYNKRLENNAFPDRLLLYLKFARKCHYSLYYRKNFIVPIFLSQNFTVRSVMLTFTRAETFYRILLLTYYDYSGDCTNNYQF